MGKLLKVYLMPHPPIMIDEIGGSETKKVQKTVNAALKVAEEISDSKPDTIVIVVPPHGPAFGDAMSINTDKKLKGNLGNFGAAGIAFDYDADAELTSAIIKNSTLNGVPVAPIDRDASKSYGIPNTLDHGSAVPLYFINKKYKEYKLVHITYGLLSPEKLYLFGKIIRESVEQCSRNAVFIASGDLSHRLTRDAPAGYSPMGADFDSDMVKYLKKPEPDSIMDMDRSLIDAAGECGYRSILIMMGSLDALSVKGNVLSYEGPFGVGYCIASYDILGEDEKKSRVEDYFQRRKDAIRSLREGESPYVKLARQSLEEYVRSGETIDSPTDLPVEMTENSAGVFVSIKKNGELRGCIGTIEPVRQNIAQEIIENAISSGTRDPRFYPVEEDELDELEYSVDVLGEPEPIESIKELDPVKYGVIVKKGWRSGLLLPNLEGIETAEEQLKIALKKAGIDRGEHYSMERFEVIRHR
jgi:AmmeMemoRadiSam system protein A/AmmeMemoRadiSam system protein B